jgi:hypothetical protein
MSKRSVSFTTLVFLAIVLACFQNCGRIGDDTVSSASAQTLGEYKGACYSAVGKLCVERWQYPDDTISFETGCTADGGAWLDSCPVNSDALGACFMMGDGEYASVQTYHYFGFYGGISFADEKDISADDCERNGHRWNEIQLNN